MELSFDIFLQFGYTVFHSPLSKNNTYFETLSESAENKILKYLSLGQMLCNKKGLQFSCSLVPRPHPTLGKGAWCYLQKIPVCAVSAVFVWSRGITFVHY